MYVIEKGIENRVEGPSLLRFKWMKLLCRLHFMPTVTVKDIDDPRGVSITFRVYHVFFFGVGDKTRSGRLEAFLGIAIRARTQNGDELIDGNRRWIRRACDLVEIDRHTRYGTIAFNPANRVL